MQFMLLLHDAPGPDYSTNDPAAMAEMERWFAYSREMEPFTVSGAPLMPAETSTCVRVRDNETLLTDGPFAETKEQLGGYYIIDVPDLETACAWAAKAPNATSGTVEVRPVLVLPAG